MSENPEVPENLDNICNLKSPSKEVAECMTGWLTFIQVSGMVFRVVFDLCQLQNFGSTQQWDELLS